jgi:hypothetical protein
MPLEQAKNINPSVCQVRGWVVDEDETRVVTCAGKSTDDWVTLRFVIPKDAIISREVMSNED